MTEHLRGLFGRVVRGERRQWLLRAVQGVGLLLVVGLLGVHTFGWAEAEVDSVSLGLIGLLLLIPLVDRISVLKVGSIEARLTPEQREALQEARITAERASGDGFRYPGVDPYSQILDLNETDEVAAMLRTRAALESAMRRALTWLDDGRPPLSSARAMAERLRELSVIDELQFSAIASVRPLMNAVAHGEPVRSGDTRDIVRSMLAIVRQLDAVGPVEPIAEEVISQSESDRLSEAMYEVTSVVPLVSNPKRVVRRVSQEQLDALLKGYEEYAEFLIRIEAIEDLQPPSKDP